MALLLNDNRSLVFDGSGDYATPGVTMIGTVTFFPTTTQTFSVVMWYYARNSGNANNIFSKFNFGTLATAPFHIRQNAGGAIIAYLRGSATTLAASGSVLNQWNHLAVTWDGTNGYAYVNGGATITLNVGTAVEQPNSPIEIGGSVTAANLSIDGYLSDVRIWNIARTQAQITQMYKQRLTGSETGLAAYWKLSDPIGTTLAADSRLGSGTTYPLTIVNAVFTTANVPFLYYTFSESDSTTVTDTFSKTFTGTSSPGVTINLTDQFTVSDNTILKQLTKGLLTDTTSISDNQFKNFTRNFNTDQISTTDGQYKNSIINFSLDNVTTSDNISKDLNKSNFSDQIILNDSISKSLDKMFLDIQTQTDEVIKQITLTPFDETINLSDLTIIPRQVNFRDIVFLNDGPFEKYSDYAIGYIFGSVPIKIDQQIILKVFSNQIITQVLEKEQETNQLIENNLIINQVLKTDGTVNEILENNQNIITNKNNQ